MKDLIQERIKLLFEKKEKKEERLEFYKEYYSNLSPDGFAVKEEDGKIIIELSD